MSTITSNYAFDGCTTLATVTLNSNAAIGTGAVPSSAATHLILQDKQPLLMNNNTFGSVSYVRNYNNTNWQALYLPYAISYDDWSQNHKKASISQHFPHSDTLKELFIIQRRGQKFFLLLAASVYSVHPKKAATVPRTKSEGIGH
ncbi:MAG: hypothetical protein IKM65_01560 [Bacteroidaceae bacterium]|nr:hypothetical protein [Bacteroidaceae bacterium]